MTRAAAMTAQAAGDAERLVMSETDFSDFYALTARPLKSYLLRLTGDAALADDLLQESYYRYLRIEIALPDATQRKNYLFKIATNLTRDHFRSKQPRGEELPETLAGRSFGDDAHRSADVERVLGRIPPRERELVWLAYVEGASHREIASITGLKEASVRPVLFRIRQKLAGLLRPGRAQ